MTKKTTNRFSPEVRERRAVRMVQEHASDHASQWAAIGSMAAKIGGEDRMHDRDAAAVGAAGRA